ELQARLDPNANVSESIQKIKDATAYAVSRWVEASGQAQYWALSVGFGNKAAMPGGEWTWPARARHASVLLKCHFEPADPAWYYYPPEPCCRLFNYEYRTVIYYWATRLSKDAAEPERYRKEVMETVRDQRRSTAAFLRWKLEGYRKQNPD